MASVHQPSIPILYLDQWIVVVSKPSGVAVHRGWARSGPMALQLVRNAVGTHVFPAHRLDQATSGALLFALDADTARRCAQLFMNGSVSKTYLALVRGFAPPHIVLDHPLRQAGRTERVPAVTEFRHLANSPVERCSLVEARPRTGRLHQVRRHLKHLSLPIVGDVRYGKGDINRHYRATWNLHRLALHASRLAFDHPVTRESLDLHAPLPHDLMTVFEDLGLLKGRIGRGNAGSPARC